MEKTMRYLVWTLLGLFGVMILLSILQEAKAHSWYPFACCSGTDCAEITEWVPLPDGGAVVTNKFGSFKLSRQWINENSQPSQDWHSHICVKCDQWGTQGCIKFVPRPKCMFVGGGV